MSASLQQGFLHLLQSEVWFQWMPPRLLLLVLALLRHLHVLCRQPHQIQELQWIRSIHPLAHVLTQ